MPSGELLDAALVDASGAQVAAPSMSVTSREDVLIGVFSVATGASFTAPSSMLERGETSAAGKSKVSLELADEFPSVSGDTGSRTATADKAGTGIGQLVALRPAGQAPVTTVPGAPTSLAATGGAGTVHLSWTAPASDGGTPVTGYRLYRSTSTGTETFLRNVVNVTSIDDSVAAGTYYYKITAVNAVGEGLLSNEATATATAVVATTPGAPLNLTAAPASGKGVQLAWTAASSDGGSAITGYKIYRGTATGSVTLLTSVGVVTGFKDTATTRGATYFYVVSAVNAVGEGIRSGEANATAK